MQQSSFSETNCSVLAMFVCRFRERNIRNPFKCNRSGIVRSLLKVVSSDNFSFFNSREIILRWKTNGTPGFIRFAGIVLPAQLSPAPTRFPHTLKPKAHRTQFCPINWRTSVKLKRRRVFKAQKIRAILGHWKPRKSLDLFWVKTEFSLRATTVRNTVRLVAFPSDLRFVGLLLPTGGDGWTERVLSEPNLPGICLTFAGAFPVIQSDSWSRVPRATGTESLSPRNKTQRV